MHIKLISVVVTLIVTASAQAAVVLDVIDRGTPTDGVTTLDGFKAFVLRARSTDGQPITRIELSGPGGIRADNLQRWVDPLGGTDYQPTPIHPADNTTPTRWNFDTHALSIEGATTTYVLETARSPFDPAGVPIATFPGEAFYEPRDTVDQLLANQLQVLGVDWDIPDSLGLTEIDFAYVVTDSLAGANVQFTSPSGLFDASTGLAVPEPSTGLTAIAAVTLLLRRRRRRPVMEQLESRRMLSGSAIAIAESDVSIR